MSNRIITLLPPTRAQLHPVFLVRRDLGSRLVAYLEHRGFRAALAGSPNAAERPVAEVIVEAGPPLSFLASAKEAFLAQVQR